MRPVLRPAPLSPPKVPAVPPPFFIPEKKKRPGKWAKALEFCFQVMV